MPVSSTTIPELQRFIDVLILGGRTRMTMTEIEREIGIKWGTSEFQMKSKFNPLVKFGIIKVDPVAVGVFKLIGSGTLIKKEVEEEAERIDKLLDDIAED